MNARPYTITPPARGSVLPATSAQALNKYERFVLLNPGTAHQSTEHEIVKAADHLQDRGLLFTNIDYQYQRTKDGHAVKRALMLRLYSAA